MNKEALERMTMFMEDEFKGLSKEYMVDKITNEIIQREWQPKVGDIIVGETGNIFVISAHTKLDPTLGGDRYFYGGGMCNRDGGNIMDSTYCYQMNADGLEYYYDLDGEGDIIKTRKSSKISDYKYVPYPHELPTINEDSDSRVGHRVPVIESEMGWGAKTDDYMICRSRSEAKDFITEFNADNNLDVVPDWYMYAEDKIEVCELTLGQYKILQERGNTWWGKLKRFEEFKLVFCEECIQMTNHYHGECQKHNTD